MPDFITVNPIEAQKLASKAAFPLVQATTERIAMKARLLAPGSMKDHIRAVTLPGAQPRGLVISDHPATVFVIDGTKRHVVRPKKGKYLVFTPKGSATKVFTKKPVTIPARRANNFLLKAMKY